MLHTYCFAVFTGFLHLSCAGLLNTPVLPVTCDIICAGGDMWFYHGFCTSCLCLYLSSCLLPCIHAFIILYSRIRYSELTVRVNPIAPPQQHRAPASCAPSCYNGNCLANLEFKVVGGIQKIPGSRYVEVT